MSIKFEIPNHLVQFESMEEVHDQYSEGQILEMINRFWSAQWTAKKSRVKREEAMKMVRQDPRVKAAMEEAMRKAKEELGM